MLRSIFNNMLLKMQKRYDYDVRYQQDILKSGLGPFLKFMGFQSMASHTGRLPVDVLYAARIRAIIWDDCGPCTQLVVNMALEAEVEEDVVKALVDRNFNRLPEHLALVVRFTELVMAHNPEADDLREGIRSRWGESGLVSIAFAISSYRVYPALKYALGYGKACSRVMINNAAIAPGRG